MCRNRRAGIWALSVALLVGAAAKAQEAPPVPKVALEFFYEPGCSDCARVREDVLPRFRQQYAGLFELSEVDLGVPTNYVRLVSAMDRLGVAANAHVYMLVNGVHLLAGFDAIAAQLAPVMDQALSEGLAAAPPAPGAADLAARARSFAVVNVALGGLVDGINPCAIATLVFLMSVLSMAKVSGRRLLLVGGAFCLASFLTYFAIGFGLLRALHALAHFRALQRAFELALLGVLLVLALLSFRDAWRFKRSGRAEDVTLQLSDRLKGRVHRLMRTGLSRRAQAGSAFGIGALVTGIESVCTGQVYAPTLVLVVKAGLDTWRSLALLLLYDFLFVLPLLVVLWLTYAGMELFHLLDWSRRNVVTSKVLLGLFFLGLAAAFLLIG